MSVGQDGHSLDGHSLKAAKVDNAGGFLTPGLACLLVQFGLGLDRFLLLVGKPIGDAHNNGEEAEP